MIHFLLLSDPKINKVMASLKFYALKLPTKKYTSINWSSEINNNLKPILCPIIGGNH